MNAYSPRVEPGADFCKACQDQDRAQAKKIVEAHPERAKIEAVCDRFADLDTTIEFLCEYAHLLHDFHLDPLSDWIRHHLWEANRWNVMDVMDEDDRGRTAASIADKRDIVTLLASRKRKPVPRDNWALPYHSPAALAFIKTCEAGDADKLEQLLADDPELIRARTKWGMTATYSVAGYGSKDSEQNLRSVRILTEAGEPDPLDAMVGASWWGAADIIVEMLELGVSPEDRAREMSALHTACVASSYNELAKPEQFAPIVDALINKGADPSWPDPYGWMPYGMAAEPVRQVLRAHGVEPRELRPELATFLQMVEAKERDKILELAKGDPGLLRFRARSTDSSAILSACFDDDESLARELQALKLNLDLDEAAALGDRTQLDAALALDPQLGPRWYAGELRGRPMHMAAWFNQQSLIDRLVEVGYSPADTNQPDVAGKSVGPKSVRATTPLHIASERGHKALTEKLVSLADAHRGR